MRRNAAFRPALNRLEDRIVPTVGAYPDPFRTAIHESYVTTARSAPTNVTFLGDSITFKWGQAGASAWQATFASAGAVDFGLNGDQTQNVLYRVEDGELAGQPKVAVLMVGINDLLGNQTPWQTEDGIAQVVAAIRAESPSTKVLVLSVLPTASTALNQQVTQLDSLLSGLGKQAGVTYLDIESSLMGPNNVVGAGLTSDGFHPSAAGYAILAQAINPTLISLLSPTDPTTPTTVSAGTTTNSTVLPVLATTMATTIVPVDLGSTTTDLTLATPSVHHKSARIRITFGPSS